MKQINFFEEIIVDNFAGGGGASTGIELATGRPVNIAINHDENAIALHKANHPYTEHFCESVWDVKPREVCRGRKVALAWFSPDCTHFSKAKGKKPVRKDIRGLAWVALRWAATVKPRVIMLENVEEFKTWGPLIKDEFGQEFPDPKRKGETFESFKRQLTAIGYKVDYRELRACDYGAPTIRKRFFLIARSDGEKIVWPEPTHGDPESDEVKSGKLKPYRTASECIDWSIPCPSIFDTAEEIKEKFGIRAVRPLAENTMKRIARGIQKFIVENPEPFIVRVNHSVTAPTLIQYHSEQAHDSVRGQNIENPILTIDGSPRYALVSAFVSKYFSGGYKGVGSKVSDPLGTVTSIDHNAIVTAFISRQFGTSTGHKMDEPSATLTAVNKSNLAKVFLIKYYGQGTGQKVDEPLGTVVSRDRFGIVTVKGEEYQIVDIGMRMLEPKELYRAQGFPEDYIIDFDVDGKQYSKAEKVKRVGNSVPPAFAEALTRANLPELCEGEIKTMEELKRRITG
jgi:DNA (cytosine-5)-methyltransferase 1